MKKYTVEYIAIHCSDSDVKAHDDISVIASWHSERGWVGTDGINGTPDDVGYNYFLTKNGSIQVGRVEGVELAHAKGYNKGFIAICLSGRHNFGELQFRALRTLIYRICEDHPIKRVYYHNELNPHKTCPNFKLPWLEKFNEELQAKKR